MTRFPIIGSRCMTLYVCQIMAAEGGFIFRSCRAQIEPTWFCADCQRRLTFVKIFRLLIKWL